jgi:alpha-1,2-mannosyltransferase
MASKAARLWQIFGLYAPLVLIVTLLFTALMLRPDVEILLSGSLQSSARMIGRDFVNIWHGGSLALSDGAAAVYDRDVYLATLRAKTGLLEDYNFSYPPHLLAMATGFGLLPYGVALLLWTGLTWGLLAWAARPWLAEVGLPLWAVLLLPASLVNAWAGHFGFLIAALALWGFRLADQAPARAGLAFALMTVKPHLGVLVPLLLAVKARWRVIGWASAITLALIGGSLLCFGAEPWTTWLTATLGFQSALIGLGGEHPYLLMMPTTERSLAALGVDGALSTIVQAIIAVGALSALWGFHRAGVRLPTLGLLSLLSLPLLLPYLFTYDLVGYSLAVLLLLARLSPQLRGPERGLFALAFVMPLLHMPLAQAGIQLVPLVSAALLFALYRRRALLSG